MEQF
jgi:FixJ family two-component response regulator